MTISRLYSRIKRPLFYLGVIVILSCAGSDDEGYFSSFFQPETSVKGISFQNYHFSPSFFYGSQGGYDNYYSDSSEYAIDDNLESWIRYIGGNFSIQDAGQAIYRRNKSLYSSGHNAEVSTAFLDAIRLKPAGMKYLEFAWEVEAAQTKSASWDDDPSGNDKAVLAKLLPKAISLARAEKDIFLKDRYAFQAVKICGELRKLDEEIKLYTEFFGKSASHSPIYYWAESRIGGAYLIQTDTARAIYHCAQVFQNCASKRYAAYMSLRLNDIKFIPQALTYCKSGKEKAAVYAICAIQPWQESTGILNEMLAADPTDSLIRLVYARELNKTEYDKYFAQPTYRETDEDDSLRLIKQKASTATAQSLKNFAAAALANGHVPDSAFWFTAEAHAAFLTDDFMASNDLLSKAEKIGTTDTLLNDQMMLQKFLLFSELTVKMTPAKEDELIPMLEHFSDRRTMQHSDAFTYAAARLEKLYSHQAPPVIKGGFMGCASSVSNDSQTELQYAEAKAFIFHLLAMDHYRPDYMRYSDGRKNDLELINDTSPSHTVEGAIKYFAAPNPRDFDKRLKKLSGITSNPLYRLMGTRALSEHDYAKAEEAFSHIDTTLWNDEPYKTYMAANPFWTGITDTHAGVPADTIRYTPFTYAKKMAELERKVSQNGTAEECFQLGCGSYNMSAWGNSWLLVKDSWGGNDEMGEYYWFGPPYPLDSTYYHAIVNAEKYFTEAAKRSGNKEFSAMAYFMAAKCEQKRFYFYKRERYIERTKSLGNKYVEASPAFDSLLFLDQKKSYRQYFDKLLTGYKDTKFSEEAKTECAYYNMYAAGK